MTLDNIRRSLDAMWYYTHAYGDEYLTIARKVSAEHPWIIDGKDFFCRIYLEDDRFRIADFRAQIPDDKWFARGSQVIEHIKKQFPL